MSDTALNWVALAVTVVLFAGLGYLSVSKKAGFSARVLIATALGIVVGVAFKEHTDYVAAFGDVWSNAIAAIVVPLLLFSVIASITNLGESLKLRSIGVKTVVFLLINTATAALITLGLALLFRVGQGFQFTLPTDYKQREVPEVLDTIVALFPTNLVKNWYSNQVVPVVIFAILVAVAYNQAAKTAKGAAAVHPFKAFVDAGNVVLSKATQIVVGFTPYAVLALIAAAVSNSDVAALLPLLTVLVVAYIAMIIQLFLVQPLILSAAARVNPVPFFKAFWPTGVVAFTSESSIGTIPVTVRNLRANGVPGEIASFVASLGANLGMPGCAGVWPVLLAVFAVNAQGISYSPAQYLFLVVLALLVSIGTVGVPGTATITATSLFAAAGLPIPFIAISQPISQIVDMGRTALNVAGAANTAVIVAATEQELDQDLYYGRKAFVDEDANDDELEAVGAKQAAPIASAVPAAGESSKPSALAAFQNGGSGNLLSFSPSSALEGTGNDDQCGIHPGANKDADKKD
ncbi:dicarboxylate/amino acid:cation symporter [Bifidobacterium vespertilionis]|uniref:dicarboxylate/amino acid:cation symporter n=1 Tax=Bifidobacterium vespertilionis TaxID=2562524 RepID=UPI001BDC546B|nr:dicarboxylate/amino acid:cation symporter [Bifidobacterium vespertilionis]MBT1178827.1 dicarboxylate/amino acid:cation symporter [Bifidobacterium vespertilionis]